MKKVVSNIGGAIISLTIIGLIFNFTIGNYLRREIQLGKTVRSQKGKTVKDAKLAVGEPYRIMDMKQYKDRQPGMARSFEPDPNLIECDLVYEYHEVATMGLLYVRKGIVIDTYVGGT